MVDLTHDNTDDGFHEIQLSGKQLVFLFMATTVVSVVIFLCGVLVGRAVPAERSETPDPVVTAAPAPTDTVADAAPAPVASEPPTPADETEPPLTYKSRLEGDKPPPETLKPAAEASKRPSPAAAPPVSTEAPRRERPASASKDGWVVQIVALRDRQTASSIVQRLHGKGYPAFLVSPVAGAPAPVFKVQVGRYPERDQAEQIRRRLEKEEQFKPWISR